MTSSTLIADVIGNPLLEDYGRFLFPIAFNPPWPGDTLADVAGLLTWRSFVNTDTTVDVVMIRSGGVSAARSSSTVSTPRRRRPPIPR